MSLADRLFDRSSDDQGAGAGDEAETGTEEQLSPYDGGNLAPKGEHRSDSSGGFFTSYVADVFGSGSGTSSGRRSAGVDVEVSVAPEKLNDRYDEYVKTKPLVKSPLSVFSDAVTEPGWTVTAEVDGETDDDMEDALDMWGKNCVIHAQEPGNDILTLVEQIPEKRRGKGTMYVEKVATADGTSDLGALMLLDPASIKVYSRENQPLLIQPDDDVPADHPTTDDGRAAAYTQYEDEDLYPDSDTIAFAADDLVKITYEPDEGSAWGTPLWVTIQEHVDGLYRKLRDRNASIRINGHPWRVVSNESWSYDDASRFLKKHFKGDDISTWFDDEAEKKRSFAGRLDAVPHHLDIQEHTGEVPDISDAIMDDIQAIFSVMPVSRFKLAYEESINQFVVQPQDEKDQRLVDKEQGVIRQHIEPLFEEKADELAGGEYDGEITWKLEQPADENPLVREGFDSDDFAQTAKAFTDADAPPEVIYWLAGIDREEFEYVGERHVAGEDMIDETDEAMQEAGRAMGLTDDGGGAGAGDGDDQAGDGRDEETDDEDAE